MSGATIDVGDRRGIGERNRNRSLRAQTKLWEALRRIVESRAVKEMMGGGRRKGGCDFGGRWTLMGDCC